MTVYAGQQALAQVVYDRFEAGDDEGRVIGDLLTVLAAVISDMPNLRQRQTALLAAATLPEVVTNLVTRRKVA